MDMALKTARVALVGNPNSGKTALFNALTGAHQKVANYAGVTVERKEGVITQVGAHCHHQGEAVELERRLLELGFVEGAHVELLHEGLFGRDPIAVKVDDMRIALRRKEAASLTLELNAPPELSDFAEAAE